MAKKSTLNAKNLETLGAKRLAELLLELSEGDAERKRRLRLELAGAANPDELAKQIRNRLNAIARSESFVDWRGVRKLKKDLETLRKAIVEKVAENDSKAALELLWRFMEIANSVFQRSGDGSGVIIDEFHCACVAIGDVASRAEVDPVDLANRVYEALVANDYGQYDDLIEVTGPTLGKKGLDHLKELFLQLSNHPIERPSDGDRIQAGWSSAGAIYEDEMAERSRLSTVKVALQEIADAQGDVDAFIKQFDEKTQKVPRIAAEIANRLVEADRPEDALAVLDRAEHRKRDDWSWPDFDWEDTRIEVLEALGRDDEVQQVRWQCFERSLSASHLRDYLKKLPDFDDFEAEEKALSFAEAYPRPLEALSFLISWPALDRAARLVTEKTDKIDGDYYEILTPAADALAGKHPLAATLLLRAMIDFSLNKSRSSRYKHAARHLLECSSLSKEIDDFGPFDAHKVYEAKLRQGHGRKDSFWSRVG